MADSISELVLSYINLPDDDYPTISVDNGTGPGTLPLVNVGSTKRTSPLVVVSHVSNPGREDFGKFENISVYNGSSTAENGTLSSNSGVYVSWDYPVIPPEIVQEIPNSPDSLPTIGTKFGSFPVAVSSVAYEVKIFEGSFSDSDFVETGSAGGLSVLSRLPDSVVYSQASNLSIPDRPIMLENPNKGLISIPDGTLEIGVDYTVAFRQLVWHPGIGQGREWVKTITQGGQSGFYATGETVFFHFLTQWTTARFRVNQGPAITQLRVNGLSDPTVKREDDLTMSFLASDPDGPRLFYRIEIGTSSGTEFSPNIYDSGLIRHSEDTSESIEVTFQLPSIPLFPSIDYFWRVSSQDGISSESATDATDKFRINSPPSITSLKVGGQEILFGEIPTVSNENISISWEFSDSDEDGQQGYVLSLFSGGSEFLSTGIVASSAQTLTVPELPSGKTIEISLKVKDEQEFGDEVRGNFVTNAPPVVQNLLIEGEENPRSLSTSTPTFSWDFSDPEASSQTNFRIQVSDDAEYSNIIWDTGNKTSSSSSVVYGSTSSPTVPPEALVHGKLYHVRVTASDGTTYSDFVQGFFAVNTAPGAPVLVSPSSGAFSDTISIQWAEASPLDADGDTITYVIEITDRRSFDRGWTFLAGPLPSGTTSYDLDVSSIPSGDNYGVRILSNDGFADSSPATSPRFTINNHAPVAPTILRPSTGDTVSRTLRIEWSESNPVDVDGDPVLYELQLSSNASDNEPIWNILTTLPSGRPGVLIDVSELEDGTDYRLRIRATDAPGDSSDFNESGIFEISNATAVSDFETFNGILYLGSTDGRIFRAQDTIWQVDEDWSDQRGRTPFETFIRGEPSVNVANGKLIISPVPGTTFLLRHSGKGQ